MTREELSEGYVRLMDDLYQPQAFFDRLDSLYLDGKFRYASHHIKFWRRKPWQWFRRMRYATMFFVGAALMLMFKVKDSKLRRIYSRRLLRLMWRRWEPELWFIYVLKAAGHYHFYLMAEQMKARLETEGKLIHQSSKTQGEAVLAEQKFGHDVALATIEGQIEKENAAVKRTN